MKNQREIYKALLAGETLASNRGLKVKLDVDDMLISVERPKLFEAAPNFGDPDEWKTYQEPKWHENIPDGGVLCWAIYSDGTQGASPVLVLPPFGESDPDNYELLIKQEIQVFYDNAPEITECRHNLLPDNPSAPQHYKCTKCNHVQGRK